MSIYDQSSTKMEQRFTDLCGQLLSGQMSDEEQREFDFLTFVRRDRLVNLPSIRSLEAVKRLRRY